MTKDEKAVIRAAMHWFRAEGGYFYRNHILSNERLARKLEDACARLSERKRK